MNRRAESAATLQLFDGLFESPALYLRKLDIPGDRVRFAYMTEGAYADSAFLDWRLERASGREFGLKLSQLLEVRRRVNPPCRPMHFLFHIGHCGSTLLSRMLGALGGTLSLREPPPLLELAQARRALRAGQGEMEESRWREAYELTLTLLSRTFNAQDVALVKPNSHANNLIGELLDWHPDCRAVLLYIDLENYLATMLRPHTREETERAVIESRHADFLSLGGDAELAELDDARKAALVWLVQMREINEAVATHRGRVYALEFADFLADSRRRLASIAGFLGRAADAPAIDRALDPALTRQYSKLTEHRYDARARQRMIDESRRANAAEIKAGIDWADAVRGRCAAFEPFAGVPENPRGS
ncbi:MAG: hypothetical protein ACREVN_12215 [Gammaproteobacteria bacterium]